MELQPTPEQPTLIERIKQLGRVVLYQHPHEVPDAMSDHHVKEPEHGQQ